MVRTVDELVGGLSHRSLDSGRIDGAVRPSLSFSDIAVLYRTDAAGRPDRGRADPGRASRCRSARTTGCGTGPGWRRIARELRHADGLARLARRPGCGWPVRCVAERFAVPTLDGAGSRSVPRTSGRPWTC